MSDSDSDNDSDCPRAPPAGELFDILHGPNNKWPLLAPGPQTGWNGDHIEYKAFRGDLYTPTWPRIMSRTHQDHFFDGEPGSLFPTARLSLPPGQRFTFFDLRVRNGPWLNDAVKYRDDFDSLVEMQTNPERQVKTYFESDGSVEAGGNFTCIQFVKRGCRGDLPFIIGRRTSYPSGSVDPSHYEIEHRHRYNVAQNVLPFDAADMSCDSFCCFHLMHFLDIRPGETFCSWVLREATTAAHVYEVESYRPSVQTRCKKVSDVMLVINHILTRDEVDLDFVGKAFLQVILGANRHMLKCCFDDRSRAVLSRKPVPECVDIPYFPAESLVFFPEHSDKFREFRGFERLNLRNRYWNGEELPDPHV